MKLLVALLALAIIGCKKDKVPEAKPELPPPIPEVIIPDPAAMFSQLRSTPAELKDSMNDPVLLAEAQKRSEKFARGTACEKAEVLWDAIYRTREEENGLVPFTEDKVQLFLAASLQRFWRSVAGFKDGRNEISPEDHSRLSHRHAVYAQLRFIMNDEALAKYTGLFQGSDCVLGRFSVGFSPSTFANRFAPGFAAKFFVDGENESRVILAQHSIAGQGANHNYLEYPLSNKSKFIQDAPEGIAGFSRFLHSAEEYLKSVPFPDPRELSVSQLASIGKNGQPIANPLSPRFIYFIKASGRKFPSETHDFRQDFLRLNQEMTVDATSNASKASKGLPIFDIYASETFSDDPLLNAKKIGSVETSSLFVASDAADRRVFMRHSFDPARDAIDYPGEYPKSTWNDSTFGGVCEHFGASKADMQPNEADPTGDTSVFFQRFIKERKCSSP